MSEPIQPGDIYVMTRHLPETYYMVIERKLEGDRGWWLWDLTQNRKAWEQTLELLDSTIYRRVA